MSYSKLGTPLASELVRSSFRGQHPSQSLVHCSSPRKPVESFACCKIVPIGGNKETNMPWAVTNYLLVWRAPKTACYNRVEIEHGRPISLASYGPNQNETVLQERIGIMSKLSAKNLDLGTHSITDERHSSIVRPTEMRNWSASIINQFNGPTSLELYPNKYDSGTITGR